MQTHQGKLPIARQRAHDAAVQKPAVKQPDRALEASLPLVLIRGLHQQHRDLRDHLDEPLLRAEKASADLLQHELSPFVHVAIDMALLSSCEHPIHERIPKLRVRVRQASLQFCSLGPLLGLQGLADGDKAPQHLGTAVSWSGGPRSCAPVSQRRCRRSGSHDRLAAALRAAVDASSANAVTLVASVALEAKGASTPRLRRRAEPDRRDRGVLGLGARARRKLRAAAAPPHGLPADVARHPRLRGHGTRRRRGTAARRHGAGRRGRAILEVPGCVRQLRQARPRVVEAGVVALARLRTPGLRAAGGLDAREQHRLLAVLDHGEGSFSYLWSLVLRVARHEPVYLQREVHGLRRLVFQEVMQGRLLVAQQSQLAELRQVEIDIVIPHLVQGIHKVVLYATTLHGQQVMHM
mmetsp:Transcript_27584/g.91574  ORF Transcript_27584/g.91574 Transcript_27584/m.91574 type:complete len:409 (+) Transcript_27584:1547-2773(+)